MNNTLKWTFFLFSLMFFGWAAWDVGHPAPAGDPRTNGGSDRLFCDTYCREGNGYLAEFENGEHGPVCSCFVTDSVDME